MSISDLKNLIWRFLLLGLFLSLALVFVADKAHAYSYTQVWQDHFTTDPLGGRDDCGAGSGGPGPTGWSWNKNGGCIAWNGSSAINVYNTSNITNGPDIYRQDLAGIAPTNYRIDWLVNFYNALAYGQGLVVSCQPAFGGDCGSAKTLVFMGMVYDGGKIFDVNVVDNNRAGGVWKYTIASGSGVLNYENKWHHLRLEKYGTTTYLYVDLFADGSWDITHTSTNTAYRPTTTYIGDPTTQAWAGMWTRVRADYVTIYNVTACSPHASYSCYDNDVYWYDSCGVREEKKEECATDYWTNNYRCSGQYRQREYIHRGCSGSSCYSWSEWINVADCGSDYWTNNYRCSGQYQQREYVHRGCSGSSCYSWSEWINVADCGGDYWTNEYRCNGTMKQRKYISRGCSGGSCYYNEIWYDWEQCNNYDGCYAYDTGCENRDYYCSAGSCLYSVSSRNTDYYDAYVNYCSGTTVRRHQLFHDFYCDGGICKDHTSWQNDQLVQDCGSDYWTSNYRCSGQYRQREYIHRGCSGSSCSSWSEWINVQDCGGDYCEGWGSNYCKDNDVYHKRTCHFRGCSGTSCYDNIWTDEQKVQDCAYGCENGVCLGPTLSVSLQANPSSGYAPLNDVDLTATVSGTAQGTINYKFDCTNDGTWEHVFNNILDNPKTVIDACDYPASGTYTAKVYVERDVAAAATDTTVVIVETPPNQAPNASIACNPSTCSIFQGEVLTLLNQSTDPNGQNDISKSEWDILNWGASPDLSCVGLCNFTVQSQIMGPGNFTAQLYIKDKGGLSDTDTKGLTIKKDATAGFMCSLDNENWRICEELIPTIGEVIYLKDEPSLSEHSDPSGGAAIVKRIWKINGVTFSSDNNNNPSLTLTESSNEVQLTIEDSAARRASVTHTVLASLPLPEWIEIRPF